MDGKKNSSADKSVNLFLHERDFGSGVNDALQALITVSMLCYRALGTQPKVSEEDVIHIARANGMQLEHDQAVTVLGLTTIMRHLPPEAFIVVVGIAYYLMNMIHE